METVAQYPFHHWRLRFHDMQEWEEWIPRGAGQAVEGFPKLQMLSLVGCSELQGTLPERFPLLKKLVIVSCEQLLVTIQCLPALSELHIDGYRRVVFSSPINFSSLKSIFLRDIANQVVLAGLFEQGVTDRNRDTQDMRPYASVDAGCADCGRRASGACVWEYNALDSLEFRQADPVEFGELVASRGFNAEEGSRKILTYTSWELRPFS